MNIKEIKRQEVSEMYDFLEFVTGYGHIFYDDPRLLNEPFRKIMEGIEEVRQIVDDNYSR